MIIVDFWICNWPVTSWQYYTLIRNSNTSLCERFREVQILQSAAERSQTVSANRTILPRFAFVSEPGFRKSDCCPFKSTAAVYNINLPTAPHLNLLQTWLFQYSDLNYILDVKLSNDLQVGTAAS